MWPFMDFYVILNAEMMKCELSILIPTYNGDCLQLATALSRQAEELTGISYELVIADDGSTDHSMVERCRQTESLPHCRFIERDKNSGRAAIRNFLTRQARCQWLLFLDGDMTIISPHFLKDYLDCDADIIYGGYSVGTGQPSNLRYRYEKECEPQHQAEERCKRPFHHFHTCNFMVRRDIMLAHPFDERFRNYGYEDVFFGKQLKKAGLTITHINNPVGFCTYESNAHFVSKTEEALRTLHQFRDDLQGYSQLLTFADGIHLDVVRMLLRLWHRLAGPLERSLLCSSHPVLSIFKLYKLGYYLSIKN